MVDTEKYLQAIVSQLVRIEQDMRKLNETMYILAIQEIRLNRISLKSLDLQFNVKEIKTDEIDKEFELLKKDVIKLSDSMKDVSNTVSLPMPKGEE